MEIDPPEDPNEQQPKPMFVDPTHLPNPVNSLVSNAEMGLPRPNIPQIQTPSLPESEGTSIESLMQKFSCLGTSDREVLINQFKALMNDEIEETAAIFFLEMSNWNLQQAIGYYLDSSVLLE